MRTALCHHRTHARPRTTGTRRFRPCLRDHAHAPWHNRHRLSSVAMSTPPAANPDLLQRLDVQPPLVWLQERDVDLLICAELHVDGPLRRHFAKIAHAAADDFRGAWVSHRDDAGETDLVVGFGSARWKALLLVENKVSAEFQPDQPQRYRERARRYALVPPYPTVTSVLLAPAAYFGRTGSRIFDRRVSYEELVEALADAQDGRTRLLSAALRAVLDRRRYVPEPDATVTAIWQTIYEVATDQAPLLCMAPPGEKPKGARFVYFNPEAFASIASGVDRGDEDPLSARPARAPPKRRLGYQSVTIFSNGAVGDPGCWHGRRAPARRRCLLRGRHYHCARHATLRIDDHGDRDHHDLWVGRLTLSGGKAAGTGPPDRKPRQARAPGVFSYPFA